MRLDVKFQQNRLLNVDVLPTGLARVWGIWLYVVAVDSMPASDAGLWPASCLGACSILLTLDNRCNFSNHKDPTCQQMVSAWNKQHVSPRYMLTKDEAILASITLLRQILRLADAQQQLRLG